MLNSDWIIELNYIILVCVFQSRSNKSPCECEQANSVTEQSFTAQLLKNVLTSVKQAKTRLDWQQGSEAELNTGLLKEIQNELQSQVE